MTDSLKPTPPARVAPENDLVAAYAGIRAEAMRVAGGPGDMPQRVALLHAIFVDSHGNHAFPEVALHGALWAYGFYERRGAVSRAISYRYFYDRDERAHRAYMLFEFAQGFKEANRSVFVDTYANYLFTKRHGEAPGAEEVIPAQLLDALGRVHHAARAGRTLPAAERTVFLRFHDFGETDERIEKAVRSYELAERTGWAEVADTIRYHAVLPPTFHADPVAYAGALRAATAA